MEAKEELKLIERSKAGDGDAFETLLKAYLPMMYKVAFSYVKSDEDAADVVQESILSCFESLAQLRKPNYFKTWLIRIVINKSKDMFRQRGMVSDFSEEPEQGDFDSGYQEAEWKELLLGLDEKYREVILLHYLEGYSASEIGKLLRISRNTVLTRLSRGKKQLRNMVELCL